MKILLSLIIIATLIVLTVSLIYWGLSEISFRVTKKQMKDSLLIRYNNIWVDKYWEEPRPRLTLKRVFLGFLTILFLVSSSWIMYLYKIGIEEMIHFSLRNCAGGFSNVRLTIKKWFSPLDSKQKPMVAQNRRKVVFREVRRPTDPYFVEEKRQEIKVRSQRKSQRKNQDQDGVRFKFSLDYQDE